MTRSTTQTTLADVAPLTGPPAVETVARAPSGAVAHLGAKISHVMNGRARIETTDGELALTHGDVLVLSARAVSSTHPDPWLRSWTVYVDETFFRQHMHWAIPEHAPLLQVSRDNVPRRPF